MNEFELLQTHVRRIQIIAGVLIASVLVFSGIAALVVAGNGKGLAAADGLPMLSIIAALTAVVEIPLSFLIPGKVRQAAVEKLKAGAAGIGSPFRGMLAVLNTALIIRLAMLEGVALIASLALLLDGSSLAVIGVVIPICLMIYFFPTRDGMRRQLEQIAVQLGGQAPDAAVQ